VSRPRFVLTPEARADLIEIWNYIAEDSIDSADRRKTGTEDRDGLRLTPFSPNHSPATHQSRVTLPYLPGRQIIRTGISLRTTAASGYPTSSRGLTRILTESSPRRDQRRYTVASTHAISRE